MNPNVTYPNHIPTCMRITNNDIVDDARPTPPWPGGRRRYAGTQELRPHHPNSVQAFISVTATVRRARSPANSSLNRPAARPPAVLVRQISGSST